MKTRLINFSLTNLDFKSFGDYIVALSIPTKSSIICVANVHMFIEAYKDKRFLALVNNADMVSPDGKPLCLALKWLYGIDQERVAGMDLLPALIEEAEKNHLKIGFYGYTPEGLQVVSQKCLELYPDLVEPICISPPFRALTQEEEENYIKVIHDAGVQMLLVALGCPKQEKWMASMKGRLNTTMIGIGGALPVFAGLQSRAPKWMQDASLEWLYRLLQEPRRLFKRYFITNTLFIYLIISEKIKLSFNKSYKLKVFREMGLPV